MSFLDVFMDLFVLLLIIYLIIDIFDKNKVLEWKFVNLINKSYNWVVNKIKVIWKKFK